MKKIMMDNDIAVLCVRAKSFPEGIMEAHQAVHSLVPAGKRRFFGISRPENGVIVYKAAAEELHPGEAEKLGCERFIIKRGEYESIFIEDYIKNIHQINSAFKELLAIPTIDPQGFCLEWYVNDKDVRCMVPLQQ